MTAFSTKTLTLAIIMACSVTGYVSAEEDAPRKEKQRDSNNMLTVGVGTLQFSNYNGILIPAEVQYRRNIRNNIWYSVIFQYFHGMGTHTTYDCDWEPDCYRNTVRQNIWVAAGRFHYSLPVARRWLYLTMGAGVGLGYHYLPRHEDNDSRIGNKFLPYLTAELQWEFRLGRRGVLRLSPLILSPSRLYLSPGKLNNPVDRIFCMFDIIHLSYGVRF